MNNRLSNLKQIRLKIIYLFLVAMVAACQAFPAPVQIATITPTAGATSTATALPTSTPQPTPVPALRIDSGDTALFNGDYDRARMEYQHAFDTATDNNVKAAALWGLGRTELAAENYQKALDELNTLTVEYASSTYAARAYFLIGQANEALGLHQQAADAYNTYSQRVPGVLDGYVQEYRGDALFELNDYPGALNAYNAAFSASRLDDGLNLQIKIATTRAAFGDHAGALALYDQITAQTTNDYVKAQMDYLAGQSYVALGQKDQAYDRYKDAVEHYPLSYHAYLSLVELVNAGIEVNDLDRGMVDYYANQYDVALVSFERFIKNNPNDNGTAHYYRALTFRNMQRNAEAVQELGFFIKSSSENPNWVDAWKEKAFLQWTTLNDYDGAAQTLLDYVALVPNASDAPQFLMDAGRIYERDNQLDKAAKTWDRVANEYPDNLLAPTAMFWSGIIRYRLNDLPGALTIFQRNLLLAKTPEDHARAYFWIGKVQQQLGDANGAQQAWQMGQAIDSSEYYSMRSRDMLMGNGLFDSPTLINLNPDIAKERREAETWMRITFNLPSDTDFTGPGSLAKDPRFIRGTELWDLGMYDEARLEFESLRDSISTNAADTFRLGNHLYDIGLYRSAIFCMRQVLTLAGLEDQSASLTAPPYYNHVRYGLYYHDLVVNEAQTYGFDPLFLFSVIRQESLFEGFVKSTAGAHGLMQIVPQTGEQIAKELGVAATQFKDDDLYRPTVSLQFGTYYLAQNRDSFNGNLYAALAAYNGGPTSALIWNNIALNDPDLLVEIIRFDETRDYIRSIFENFGIYRILYSPVQ